MNLTPEAQSLAVIVLMVVVLWVTEALPLAITALLGAVACVLAGVAPAKEVFRPFADPLTVPLSAGCGPPFFGLGDLTWRRSCAPVCSPRPLARERIRLPWFAGSGAAKVASPGEDTPKAPRAFADPLRLPALASVDDAPHNVNALWGMIRRRKPYESGTARGG
jgi:hypothetical protein